MCGIIGIVDQQPVNNSLYEGLLLLQHRGQDAAGIMTGESVGYGRLHIRRGVGLVNDVFRQEHMERLRGNMGIAHARYPTAGSSSGNEAQPMYVNSPYGIALAHNGNLTNTAELAQELYEADLRHINTPSDTEVLLNVFAHELHAQGSKSLTPEQVFAAVESVYNRCRGGFAVVAMIVGRGVVGFRDKNGIRPLVLGIRRSEAGEAWMLASESLVLDAQGFEFVRDLAPGEVVYITKDGKLHAHQTPVDVPYTPCIFEHVYFARPDSTLDGISVYQARVRMGIKLAEKIKREWGDHDIDVVIPIPESSRPAALELAHGLGLPYREGLVKNRYIGRTFIMPGQQIRRKSVRQKLSSIHQEFAGKNVLLVDDSIVRGTTSEQIVEMAREAGAARVYMASAAPPVRYPNVYGIDMPTASELIAFERDNDQICEAIGADKLIYQDLEDLIDAVRGDSTEFDGFETSCFSGEYVTGDVSAEYLAGLGKQRDNTRSNSQHEAVDISSDS